MHWKRDDRSTELGLDSPTCSLLSNNLRAVADSRERVWYILVYLRAVFVATPTGEVSEVEIFLRFVGVPEPDLSSVFARTCSQQSVFFRVHPLSVRGLTFTCTRGSVIFSNMLDFAVYVWTTCVACPLATFGGSISPCLYAGETESHKKCEKRDTHVSPYKTAQRAGTPVRDTK